MKTTVIYLVMKNIAETEWSYRLDGRTVVLGNAPSCPIWVPNASGGVALEHTQLGADRRGHWLRDLGSTAGTAINGV